MSNSAVVELLRKAQNLCAEFLEGQSDSAIVREFGAVISEIESAIDLIEKHRSSIPLVK